MFFHIPAVNVKDFAENGVFTFNEPIGEEIIKLDGEWEFYWKQLYSPLDFQNNNKLEPMIVEVPSTWHHYYLDDETLPEEGFATYRLIIKFHEDDVNTIKAFYLPTIASAYNVWIDGGKKASGGIVGRNREMMEPKSENEIVPFQIKSQTVELIVQVSNFNRSTVAGIYNTIQLGEVETILHHKDQKVIYRSIVAISLLTMGLYHLVLYLFGRRQEYGLIFFATACLFAAMRTTLLEEELLAFFFPHLDWEVMVKLALNGATLGVLFFVLFTYTQFPKDMGTKSRNFIIILLALYSVFIIVTPAIVYTKTMDVLELVFMLIFAYLLYVYIKASFRQREGALINVMALSILVLFAINDFFHFNQIIRTTELTSAGLVFFLFTQAVIISKRYSVSFEKTEKLSRDLKSLNESLEQQVYDRTRELQKVNSELQNINEKLTESQQSRSRLIQNISHEISTPLTSVISYSKGMLDEVIPIDEKYVQIIHDKGSYIVQMLDDLRSLANIENREILFHLERVNIKEYLHLLYLKYKCDIKSQGSILEYIDGVREDVELYVMIDKMRIEQVIVNLLSNASKFAKTDGHIIFKLAQQIEGEIVICVKDNGIGIREDELKFVFERFFKSMNQVNEHKGSGLGLAISKEIIEYHNGQIYVESQEGEGSRFYFTLPLFSN